MIQDSRGFTLIEILIYAGIVTVIFAFAVLATYQIIDYQDRLRARLEVHENAKFLIQKLQWVLQNNSVINSPAVGASGPSLSVNKLNFGSNPLILDLSNGVARLRAGAGDPVDITNRHISASNLIIDHLGLSGQSVIRFRATIENSVASTSVDTTVFVKQ